MKIKEFYIGKKAKAHHPITCLNPEPTFTIKEVNVSLHPVYNDWVIEVRGENTAWWGGDNWSLVEE